MTLHKPDSVDAKALLSFIWDIHHWIPLSAYPQAHYSNEQLSVACLLGISVCKVYPVELSPIQPVRSYRTFSPLSAAGGRLFSVALSMNVR